MLLLRQLCLVTRNGIKSHTESTTNIGTNKDLDSQIPPRRVVVETLSEDEFMGKFRGYINSMCSFAQSTRNVHKELKETLANSNIIITQYVKVLNQRRIKDVTAKAM